MSHPISLYIDSLAAGGDGVGRIGGKVCFVPFTAPGDTVTVNIVKRNSKYLKGALSVLKEGSASRRPSPCALFEICGGCQWLHLEYGAQLAAKQEILSHALGRPDIEVVPSPDSLGYRSLARLHTGPTGTGETVTGFIHVNGQETVNIPACPVLDDRLNAALEQTDRLGQAAKLRDAEIRLVLGDAGPVACFSHTGPFPPAFYAAARDAVSSGFAGIWGMSEGIGHVIAGTADLEITGTDDRPFTSPAKSFGQANRGVNRHIADTIRAWLEDRRFETGVELFAGAGNHTVTAAPYINTLTATEIDPDACRAMEINLARRHIDHVCVASGEALEMYETFGKNADLILLNPPRTGHRALAQAVANGRHKAVLYISCNPATLSRDLAELYPAGFTIENVRGFDMFPQTAHMEAAVLLTRP